MTIFILKPNKVDNGTNSTILLRESMELRPMMMFLHMTQKLLMLQRTLRESEMITRSSIMPSFPQMAITTDSTTKILKETSCKRSTQRNIIEAREFTETP